MQVKLAQAGSTHINYVQVFRVIHVNLLSMKIGSGISYGTSLKTLYLDICCVEHSI